MNSLLMSIIETLIQSDRFMDALTRAVCGCKSLMMPLSAQVKGHEEKTREEQLLALTLSLQFLETTYQPLIARPKMELGIVIPPVSTPSETD